MSWSRKISNVNRRRTFSSRRWRLMKATLRAVIGCLVDELIFLCTFVKILFPIFKNYLRMSVFFSNFAVNFKGNTLQNILQIILMKFTNVN